MIKIVQSLNACPTCKGLKIRNQKYRSVEAMVAISLLAALFVSASSQPNIVYVILDDYGFTDIGYNNADPDFRMFAFVIRPILKYHLSILHSVTESFDEWALSGIILNRHYTEPTCSASRSALLTGLVLP